MRIARKVARIAAETSLIFGIFSRGQRSVTKEDFKYCALKRLNLRSEISEKEMDFFLQGNDVIGHKNFIEKDEFETIFKSAILMAKSDIRDEHAVSNTTGGGYAARPGSVGK